jgi:hypothetical protein
MKMFVTYEGNEVEVLDEDTQTKIAYILLPLIIQSSVPREGKVSKLRLISKPEAKRE